MLLSLCIISVTDLQKVKMSSHIKFSSVLHNSYTPCQIDDIFTREIKYNTQNKEKQSASVPQRTSYIKESTTPQTSTKQRKMQLSEHEHQKQELTEDYYKDLNHSKIINILHQFFESFDERQDEVQEEIQEDIMTHTEQEIVEDTAPDCPDLSLKTAWTPYLFDDDTLRMAMGYNLLSEDKDTLLTGPDCSWNTSLDGDISLLRSGDFTRVFCDDVPCELPFVPSDCFLTSSQLFQELDPETPDSNMF